MRIWQVFIFFRKKMFKAEMRGESRTEFVLIVTGGQDVKMSNDVFYPFHQNANFFYLTGFLEPDCVLIVETMPGFPFPQHKSILFVPEFESGREMINGLRTGTEKSKSLTGVTETRNIEQLPDFLKKYADMNVRIWARFDF